MELGQEEGNKQASTWERKMQCSFSVCEAAGHTAYLQLGEKVSQSAVMAISSPATQGPGP